MCVGIGTRVKPYIKAICRVWAVKITVKMSSDGLCGLVVRVPGYGTEMYCVSCAVRNELIYVM
jgi:hypothetical protein